MVASRSAARNGDRGPRARRIAAGLARAYPVAECALRHDSPFQLLAATILSAQCTDERVNLVTPELFRRFPTPQALAEAKQGDVEQVIQSTGFFRAKATNLRGMAQKLVAEFQGELPRTVEELITLPGVGRKTANVVLGTSFGIATGVVVDTHVKRITHLLGLTGETAPEKVERDLMALLPAEEWIQFSHRLIHHGRKICIARRPRCLECPLLTDCQRIGLPPLTDGAASETTVPDKKASGTKAAGKRPAAKKRKGKKSTGTPTPQARASRTSRGRRRSP